LYGSNAGTCKALAEDLETAADSQGFAVKVQTMDQATEHLPKDIPIIIITPSYEGKPADNAKKFVAWLESGPDEKLLKDVKYAVFGVGNSEWASTYHRVPKLVDEILGETAHRCVLTGFVDVKEDLVGPWEEWKEKILGAISGGSSKVESASKLSVSIGKSEAATKLGGKEISYGYVRKNEVIAGNEVGPAKRHIDIELSEGVTYRTGDYLVVLPYNSPTTMTRVASKFRLHLDDIVNVAGTNKAFLLGNGPSTLTELLGTRVELGTPVSQRQLQTIASTATSEGERKDLETLSSSAETFKAEVLAKRKSVLDILEDYPSTTLSFGAFLDMLKPLSPRQYSISSSPLATAAHTETGHERSVIASLTFDVHEAPARSGHDRIFQGVASTYLARQTVGSKIRCFVRATNTSFHLPNDSEIPVIMISAGTGIAPMRGFIEERAQIAKARSKKLGPALLYFGSRDFEKDYIYASQLAEWEALGAVKVRPAFSKRGPEGCCKYVPDRMWEEREEIADLFVKGAKIFVCGSASKLAKSSADVCKRIWREKNPESGEEEADKWLDGIREDRYVSDVFEGG
jgi:cytochrome P450/NADPH-cytochrome P450 reductase